MQSLGLGIKGTLVDNLEYKTQLQYLMYEETGALEDQTGHTNDIDSEMGYMFDFDLTYHFSKHYSVGNTFSYFEPGDGIEDRLNEDNLDATIYDSINFSFHF